MEIEINGIKYRQKEQPPKRNLPQSKTLMMLMTMAAMADGFGMFGVPAYKKEKEMPKVDIIKEYELIQQKKSNLSRSQRDWIIWQFEKNFEPISNDNQDDKLLKVGIIE